MGDPAGDVEWVREELHLWMFGNVRGKWSSVLRKARVAQLKKEAAATNRLEQVGLEFRDIGV